MSSMGWKADLLTCLVVLLILYACIFFGLCGIQVLLTGELSDAFLLPLTIPLFIFSFAFVLLGVILLITGDY